MLVTFHSLQGGSPSANIRKGWRTLRQISPDNQPKKKKKIVRHGIYAFLNLFYIYTSASEAQVL